METYLTKAGFQAIVARVRCVRDGTRQCPGGGQRHCGAFGRFCALELYGTIKPAECPPMNGRMAKALRYLGFDVQGT